MVLRQRTVQKLNDCQEQGAAFGSSAGRVTEGSVFPRLVKIESSEL